MTDDLVERLARLDSCAVSDALDKAGLTGVILGLTELSVPRRIAGRAVTVKLGVDDGRSSKRHLGTAAVEASDERTIIAIEHGGRSDAAGWGGILTLAATLRGAAGVIIDGACRDVDEARALDFPIYGRSPVPRTARGRVIEIDWNVRVELAGITVSPGDLIIADGSGVAVIPEEQALEIVEGAEAIVQKELSMAEAVRAGAPVSKVMGGAYENMLRSTDQ